MSEKSAEVVFDLLKYLDQRVRVRFQGGREVDGLLKGYDKLDNLVLDECVEYLRGACVLACVPSVIIPTEGFFPLHLTHLSPPSVHPHP